MEFYSQKFSFSFKYLFQSQDQQGYSCFIKGGPVMATSVNHRFIRYAQVLGNKAAALIQPDRLSETLPLFNKVSARIAASIMQSFRAVGGNIYNISVYNIFQKELSLEWRDGFFSSPGDGTKLKKFLMLFQRSKKKSGNISLQTIIWPEEINTHKRLIVI